MNFFSKICSLLFLFVFLTSCTSYVRPVSGETSLEFLADQENVNVVFDYEDLGVNEFSEEEQYIEVSVNKRNEDEANTGDLWLKKWEGQKEVVFEPNFVQGLNRGNDKDLYFLRDNDNAEYTLYIVVKYIQTGWNVGVMRKSASVDLTAKFLQTQSLKDGVKNSEALFTINNVPGTTNGGFDFTVSQRVGASFEKAGEKLGDYIDKQTFL